MAMLSGLQLAAVAISNRRGTRWGEPIAHSRARMPPIEPPMTAYQLPMPSWSAKARSAATMSRIESAGKRLP